MCGCKLWQRYVLGVQHAIAVLERGFRCQGGTGQRGLIATGVECVAAVGAERVLAGGAMRVAAGGMGGMVRGGVTGRYSGPFWPQPASPASSSNIEHESKRRRMPRV